MTLLPNSILFTISLGSFSIHNFFFFSIGVVVVVVVSFSFWLPSQLVSLSLIAVPNKWWWLVVAINNNTSLLSCFHRAFNDTSKQGAPVATYGFTKQALSLSLSSWRFTLVDLGIGVANM